MKMNDAVVLTLRISVAIGITATLAGIISYLAGFGTDVLWIGILVVVVSPLLAVAAATVSLIAEKDRKWTAVALTLICVSAIGIAISVLT